MNGQLSEQGSKAFQSSRAAGHSAGVRVPRAKVGGGCERGCPPVVSDQRYLWTLNLSGRCTAEWYYILQTQFSSHAMGSLHTVFQILTVHCVFKMSNTKQLTHRIQKGCIILFMIGPDLSSSLSLTFAFLCQTLWCFCSHFQCPIYYSFGIYRKLFPTAPPDDVATSPGAKIHCILHKVSLEVDVTSHSFWFLSLKMKYFVPHCFLS